MVVFTCLQGVGKHLNPWTVDREVSKDKSYLEEGCPFLGHPDGARIVDETIDQCIYASTERTWMPSLIILLSWMDQIRAAERDGEVVMFGMWRTTHATHVGAKMECDMCHRDHTASEAGGHYTQICQSSSHVIAASILLIRRGSRTNGIERHVPACTDAAGGHPVMPYM
ncbi:hypothetical protein HYPSUDRAFT_59565 [Hypholoma sublateritium FD-334 SS-4]|uniref:Uncharacterized protein n=1 Tax=Hypholoma sublateritium (strain FD-334 SS-4) TaxID=945553 RepID=A0A0D2LTB0_HYPSF|nr:hypothetical protein HYPSUDRAFT_59565 [Hypholoma sublateritium FD-334 SS-4]